MLHFMKMKGIGLTTEKTFVIILERIIKQMSLYSTAMKQEYAMKFRRHCTIVLCALLLIHLLGTFTFSAKENETDLTVSNGTHSIDGAFAFLGNEPLIENVQSTFLFETGSQTLMYAWKADQPQFPAGLVKIMTGLLVLENCNLSDVITVTQSALDTVSSDAISIRLKAGEKISVEDLMYAMLVYAANDAAAVLAEHTSGSVAEFVNLMNSRAEELGCTGTNYTNPHGLHDPQQVTTAKDTCRIITTALEYPQFRTMFGTEYYTIPATNLSEERILVTNNFLMNTDDVAIYHDTRVTGGRTGVTSEGFRNIASLSESGNMEIICIVMGCASTMAENGYSTEVYGGYPETIELLNRAYNNTTKQQFICAGQILKEQQVVNGDHDVFLVCKESFSTVLPSNLSRNQLSFRYTDVPDSSQAPIKAGQAMAQLEVWYGTSCIAKTEVYAANDVPVAYEKNVETAEKSNVFIIILVAFLILIVVFCAVVILLFLFFIYGRKGRKIVRNRRRKKNVPMDGTKKRL